MTQSLDNTMKLWEVKKKGFSPSPVRSYQGFVSFIGQGLRVFCGLIFFFFFDRHQNNTERVGIACTADYIATGSEV